MGWAVVSAYCELNYFGLFRFLLNYAWILWPQSINISEPDTKIQETLFSKKKKGKIEKNEKDKKKKNLTIDFSLN